ncbi:MAG: DUF2784 domain-containing protein [Gammaproteobacteria bacterium]|jgi:hypothetical protein|nr:DUF2784 domain-containing protein [Gammaproteobacteria bacterium]
MLAARGADAVLLVHFLFIAFVVAGGFLVLHWPRMAVLHLPAAAWGVLVEWMGWPCPLTPLEQMLRRAAGQEGFQGGFIEHYLWPLIYPEGLTRELQLVFGLLVLLINVTIYGAILARRRRPR